MLTNVWTFMTFLQRSAEFQGYWSFLFNIFFFGTTRGLYWCETLCLVWSMRLYVQLVQRHGQTSHCGASQWTFLKKQSQSHQSPMTQCQSHHKKSFSTCESDPLEATKNLSVDHHTGPGFYKEVAFWNGAGSYDPHLARTYLPATFGCGNLVRPGWMATMMGLAGSLKTD